MLQGAIVPNITMFDREGNLDLEKTSWHMRWMFERGADGLFLTGSYGSGPLMNLEERVAIYRLAKEVAAEFPGKILIPHVGCIDTKSAVELAKAAESLGFEMIASVPPFYYKHTEDLIVQYYKDLIDAVGIRVFAYNNPETSRFSFTVGTVRKLQNLGLAGLKDSPVDVGFLSQVYYDVKLSQREFEIIPGTSKGWLPYYAMGLRAMIAGMSNYAPEIITQLTRATFEGDVACAEKTYMVMMDLSGKLHFTDSTIASHMALYARGYDAGFPRKPMALPPFDAPKYVELRDVIKKSFDELGLELSTGDFA